MAVLDLRFGARAFSSCGKRGPLFITVHGPLTIAASLVAEHRLQTCRLSNCGSRAHLLHGMWDLPGPGLEPVSPALVGRLSTTAPLEHFYFLFIYLFIFLFFVLVVLFVFLYCRFLLVINFIHISLYMSIPIAQFSTPPSPPHRGFPPLVSIRLFSTSVAQLLSCKPVHLYHFSRFHIHALIYEISFSLSDFILYDSL